MKFLDDVHDLVDGGHRADVTSPSTSPLLGVAVGPDGALVDDRMSAALTVIDADVGGSPVAPHRHATSVELYLVVGGGGVLRVNGTDLELGPGSVAVLEPGDVHEVVRTGPDGLRFWAVSAPPWRPEDHLTC